MLLHGEMTPDARDAALAAFADVARGVLVTTDVASRGLDFTQVAGKAVMI